jgi:hypothetical protein
VTGKGVAAHDSGSVLQRPCPPLGPDRVWTGRDARAVVGALPIDAGRALPVTLRGREGGGGGAGIWTLILDSWMSLSAPLRATSVACCSANSTKLSASELVVSLSIVLWPSSVKRLVRRRYRHHSFLLLISLWKRKVNKEADSSQLAKRYNTGVEIGLAYRGRGRVHVHKMTVGTFEDFAHHRIYFTSKQDIMSTMPSGQRWKKKFQSPELQSWLGIHGGAAAGLDGSHPSLTGAATIANFEKV